MFNTKILPRNIGAIPRSASPGGDNLLTAIERGWKIDRKVVLRRHWFAGMRCIEIFHFTIRRNDVVADMAVVGNPYVQRYLSTQPHDLVEAEDVKVA